METFFDQLAPNWKTDPEKYEIREAITKRIKIKAGSLVSDIGCGTGVMFAHLLKCRPKTIFAVDISKEMINCARKTWHDERICWINADFLQADLPQVDAAVIFNAYPHFMDKSVLAKKLSLHVRPGGSLTIAHSAPRERINGVHSSPRVLKLSVPLMSAQEELCHFTPWFALDFLEDSHNLYFIRMVRV